MSKAMLLYKDIIPLSRDKHKELKMGPITGFEIASKTHWAPTAGVEFIPASSHYPIVFVAEKKEEVEIVNPILMLGLEAGRNDFVAKDFSWKSGAYLPAFIRRYPFVIAAENEDSQEFTLCFDSTFAGIGDKKGKALFNRDGTNSEFLDETIQFVDGFNREMARTREFVRLLTKYELLEKRSAQIVSSTKVPFSVQDFLVVSEEKLAKLNGEALVELNEKGYLGLIFAHLMSLANLPKLLDMHLENKAQDNAKA